MIDKQLMKKKMLMNKLSRLIYEIKKLRVSEAFFIYIKGLNDNSIKRLFKV